MLRLHVRNLFTVALAFLLIRCASAADLQIKSPDGNVEIAFVLNAATGTPCYSIQYRGKTLVDESRMGLEPDFLDGFRLVGNSTRTQDSQWENHFGERRLVPDKFTQLSIDLEQSTGRRLRIIFRAYNEGAAFRYGFAGDQKTEFHFTGERSEFALPQDTFGYEEHATEGDYRRVKVSDIQAWCERPLTLEFASGVFATLMEADNERYPRMLLSPMPDKPGALVSALGGVSANGPRGQRHDNSIRIKAGESSPWRVLIVGDKPGDLLERNYLLLNLNPPCVIPDISWIKPGKAMRDSALTTASAKAIVDLAPQLGIDYVGFDDRWYGRDETSDASVVRAPNLDIKEVAAYAKAHGIKTCVYIDSRQAKKQAEQLFPLFKNEWGVDAVKVGFAPVGPQDETSWITDVIALAAKNQLVLDIHDGYRATGNNRIYPNLLTVEGIQGNEHHPSAEHNCTLPFTRYVGGPGDYTVCYLDSRIQTTHAHQLAMGVISFSPLQWLYWYDRPAQYRVVPPEMEFWRQMPTVWDETRVIDGRIGEYAMIARRSGDAWFVGTINNSTARQLDLPLTFLATDRKYIAHLYSDDDSVSTPTHVRVATADVNSTTTLPLQLKPAGGEAIWIEPAK